MCNMHCRHMMSTWRKEVFKLRLENWFSKGKINLFVYMPFPMCPMWGSAVVEGLWNQRSFILKFFEGPVIHLYQYNPADLTQTLLGLSEEVSFTPFLTVLGVVRVKESRSCLLFYLCLYLIADLLSRVTFKNFQKGKFQKWTWSVSHQQILCFHQTFQCNPISPVYVGCGIVRFGVRRCVDKPADAINSHPT